jgi:RES domain-containing protein
MKPILAKATDGRANPRGIPCLYLATKKDTAVLVAPAEAPQKPFSKLLT